MCENQQFSYKNIERGKYLCKSPTKSNNGADVEHTGYGTGEHRETVIG